MIVDKHGKIIIEPKSTSYQLGLNIQKFFGGTGRKYITDQCEKKGNNTNKQEKNKLIQNFVNTFHIDYKTAQRCMNTTEPTECWNKFSSLNDFFIRKRIGLPKLSSIVIREDNNLRSYWKKTTTPTNFSKNNMIVSPSDCYSVYLHHNEYKIWIKGSMFTKEKLFGVPQKKVDGYDLFVFRLAPHHYHRFHCPVNGYITEISLLGNEYYSVNPLYVNSNTNVFTENVRICLTIVTKHNTMLYLAIIGAQCVSSIQLTNFKKGDLITILKNSPNRKIKFRKNRPELKLFDELGYFLFGGSTLVLGFPNDIYTSTNLTEFIDMNTRIKKAETEIQTGDFLLKKI